MNDELMDLAIYRMEQAARCIKSAEILADDEDYKGSANRSYYAIFHSMRAVLALDCKDFQSIPVFLLILEKNILRMVFLRLSYLILLSLHLM